MGRSIDVAIGLDIGTTAVRAARLSATKSGLRIDRLVEIPLPAGAMAAGSVQRPADVTRALKRLWRAGRLGERKARIAVAERHVLARKATLPWMQPTDFAEALRYQVGDALPVDLDTVELGFCLLGERQEVGASGRSSRVNDVLLVSAPRDEILTRAHAVTAARIEPIGVDLTSFALIRAAYHGLGQDDAAIHAIADIGSDHLSVVIHRDGVPLFIRTVPNAGGEAALAAVGELDRESPIEERVERVMASGLEGTAPTVVGISESSVFATRTSTVTARERERDIVGLALDPWASSLVREIADSLNFFAATNPRDAVSSLTLAGRTASLPGLMDRIATEIPVRVRRFDPYAGLPHRRRVGPVEDARFATAIGLAIGMPA